MKDVSRLLQFKKDVLRVDEEMKIERLRFGRLKNTGKPRIVTAFNLFQTPEKIADMMAGHLPPLSNNSVVLEPSAGLGRLYSATRRKGFEGKIILVENAPQCMEELYSLTNGDNIELVQRDFLNYDCPQVDAVIMNPPFKMGLDVKHINKALALLKKGGRLIALCYNGVKQNKHLKPIVDYWEVLQKNSFKESGTNVEIVFLVINKK